MTTEQEGGDWQEAVEPSEAVAEATPAVEEAAEPDVENEALSALDKAYRERYESELESERKKLEAHFNSVADKNTKRAREEAAAELARLQSENQYTQEEINHLYGVLARQMEPQEQRLFAQDIQRRRAAYQQRQQESFRNDPYLEPALELKRDFMVKWGVDPNDDPRFDMSTPKSFVDSARPILWGLMEMANQPKQVESSPEAEEPPVKSTPSPARRGSTSRRIWRASDVEAMSPAEYREHASEIDAAMKEGRYKIE